MSGPVLLISCMAIFAVAYFTYGKWLAKTWGVDAARETPAVTMRDNVDYVPTKRQVLMGHHFSSIAGAGPIVGPITAAVFGWVPVVLWIVIGSIFFGSVHDFGTLFASIRNKGQSIAVIISNTIGRRGKLLFAGFAYVCLLIVIAAFTNIVAATFVASPQSATASLLFIMLAVFFGLAVYKFDVPLSIATVAGILLMLAAIAAGHSFPLVLSKNAWVIILLIYLAVASTAPVWVLLQPRDYLNSFLLYACIFLAFAGIMVYQPTIQLPAFTAFNPSPQGNNPLFPMLFVTVACGAISGFHALVSSGTTAKQLDSEKSALSVGYGSMLIEAVLAVIAVIAVGYLGSDKFLELLKHGGPVNVFADGIGTFMTKLGFDFTVGKSFIALTISAFALTSVDTSTRLARFILQELAAGSEQPAEASSNPLTNMYAATAATVVMAGYMSFGSYLAIWPLFGIANQLLAALSLLTLAAWLKKEKRAHLMVIVPMVCMFAVCFVALAETVMANLSLNILSAALGLVLMLLAAALVLEARRVLHGNGGAAELSHGETDKLDGIRSA